MVGRSNQIGFGLVFIYVVSIVIFSKVAAQTEENPSQVLENDANKIHGVHSNFDMFQVLFKLKRKEQKDAVQRILSIKTQEKQRNLLKLVITKIVEVLGESRIKLESSGYLPGTVEFPEEEPVRDSLSRIMENTAFMSDLFLYIPDVTKPFFKNNEWDTMFKWSLGFCREIPFLDPASKTLFYLVAQELNIVEREENYSNPYAKENQKREEALPEPSVSKKKERVKKRKGPSLSGFRNKLEL